MGPLRAAAKPRDRNATQMEAFRGANNFNSQKYVFPSCLYSNDSCSMEAIISQSSKATTEGGYALSEDIIQ